jgi:hypothetical protein
LDAAEVGVRAHVWHVEQMLLEGRRVASSLERVAKDFAMLGFHRSAVLGGLAPESGDDIGVEISDDQLCHATNAINDSTGGDSG